MLNNPDLSVDFNALRFGQATLNISEPIPGEISGTLGAPGWQLTISGSSTQEEPRSLRFTGRGDVGGEEWVYDYRGFLVPDWPDAVSQRPAIAGSIIRTVQHGNAPAGFVASWYAVRQDD